MSDLANVKSMIVVFVLAGCEACSEYKPRFERLVHGFQQHGCPLAWYRPGQLIQPGVIPVLMVDAASTDPNIQAFGDQHAISALPTTLLLTRNARPVKLEGAIDDAQIYQVLASATLANR